MGKFRREWFDEVLAGPAGPQGPAPLLRVNEDGFWEYSREGLAGPWLLVLDNLGNPVEAQGEPGDQGDIGPEGPAYVPYGGNKDYDGVAAPTIGESSASPSLDVFTTTKWYRLDSLPGGSAVFGTEDIPSGDYHFEVLGGSGSLVVIQRLSSLGETVEKIYSRAYIAGSWSAWTRVLWSSTDQSVANNFALTNGSGSLKAYTSTAQPNNFPTQWGVDGGLGVRSGSLDVHQIGGITGTNAVIRVPAGGAITPIVDAGSLGDVYVMNSYSPMNGLGSGMLQLQTGITSLWSKSTTAEAHSNLSIYGSGLMSATLTEEAGQTPVFLNVDASLQARGEFTASTRSALLEAGYDGVFLKHLGNSILGATSYGSLEIQSGEAVLESFQDSTVGAKSAKALIEGALAKVSLVAIEDVDDNEAYLYIRSQSNASSTGYGFEVRSRIATATLDGPNNEWTYGDPSSGYLASNQFNTSATHKGTTLVLSGPLEGFLARIDATSSTGLGFEMTNQWTLMQYVGSTLKLTDDYSSYTGSQFLYQAPLRAQEYLAVGGAFNAGWQDPRTLGLYLDYEEASVSVNDPVPLGIDSTGKVVGMGYGRGFRIKDEVTLRQFLADAPGPTGISVGYLSAIVSLTNLDPMEVQGNKVIYCAPGAALFGNSYTLTLDTVPVSFPYKVSFYGSCLWQVSNIVLNGPIMYLEHVAANSQSSNCTGTVHVESTAPGVPAWTGGVLKGFERMTSGLLADTQGMPQGVSTSFLHIGGGAERYIGFAAVGPYLRESVNRSSGGSPGIEWTEGLTQELRTDSWMGSSWLHHRNTTPDSSQFTELRVSETALPGSDQYWAGYRFDAYGNLKVEVQEPGQTAYYKDVAFVGMLDDYLLVDGTRNLEGRMVCEQGLDLNSNFLLNTTLLASPAGLPISMMGDQGLTIQSMNMPTSLMSEAGVMIQDTDDSSNYQPVFEFSAKGPYFSKFFQPLTQFAPLYSLGAPYMLIDGATEEPKAQIGWSTGSYFGVNILSENFELRGWVNPSTPLLECTADVSRLVPPLQGLPGSPEAFVQVNYPSVFRAPVRVRAPIDLCAGAPIFFHDLNYHTVGGLYQTTFDDSNPAVPGKSESSLRSHITGLRLDTGEPIIEVHYAPPAAVGAGSKNNPETRIQMDDPTTFLDEARFRSYQQFLTPDDLNSPLQVYGSVSAPASFGMLQLQEAAGVKSIHTRLVPGVREVVSHIDLTPLVSTYMDMALTLPTQQVHGRSVVDHSINAPYSTAETVAVFNTDKDLVSSGVTSAELGTLSGIDTGASLASRLAALNLFSVSSVPDFPSSPKIGDVHLHKEDEKLYKWDGSQWVLEHTFGSSIVTTVDTIAVDYRKGGPINAPTIMRLDTDFGTTGWPVPNDANYKLRRIRLYASSSTASAAGTMVMHLRSELPRRGTPHAIGTGSLVLSHNILIANAAVSPVFDELQTYELATPVDLTQDTILYCEFPQVGFWYLNDVEVELLLEVHN